MDMADLISLSNLLWAYRLSSYSMAWFSLSMKMWSGTFRQERSMMICLLR